MTITINIGLARNDGLPGNTVGKALTSLGYLRLLPHVITLRVAQSNTEKTLVVHLSCDELYPSKIATLCDELAQDCIAVWDHSAEEGDLVGPNAAKWGPFNPAYFLEV